MRVKVGTCMTPFVLEQFEFQYERSTTGVKHTFIHYFAC